MVFIFRKYEQVGALKITRATRNSRFELEKGKGKWKLWTEAEATFAIPRDVRFDEIVVPTAATVRNRHLISLLAQRGQPMALAGDAASGKTTAITVSRPTPRRIS